MFGLYVGNSSACIASLKDEGEVQVLVNDVGSRVTTASVEISDNERVVGASVKLGPNNSENVIYQSKVHLCPLHPTKTLAGYCPAHYDNENFIYTVDLGSKTIDVTAKEVALEIFRYLYKIANSATQGNGDVNAVLTIPYYFDQSSKYDYYEAAVSAGFNVCQVIVDPAAAAMAYNCLTMDDTSRKILVYRVGGVSMELTVAQITSGMLEILKSAFTTGVGGNTLTETVFSYLVRDVEMRMQFNPLENVRSRLKLLKLAEDCKRILSTNSSTTCCLETFYNGMDYSHTVTRSRVESLFAPVINKLISPIKALLKELSLEPDDIDKVILCGGTLKIPKLQKSVKDLFANSEILCSITPDEVFAVGAAKQGSYVVEDVDVPYSMVHKDITRLKLPIHYKEKSGDQCKILVPRGEALPISLLKMIKVNSESEETIIQLYTFDNDRHTLLKEIPIAKVEENNEVMLQIDVESEGILDCQVLTAQVACKEE